jgi:hypothetical protein
MEGVFYYKVSQQEGYISGILRGELDREGFLRFTEEILKLSEETGIKNFLYDADGLGAKNSYRFRKATLDCFLRTSNKADKIAHYLPELKMFSLGKFITIASGAKNLNSYRDKKKAIEWLTS